MQYQPGSQNKVADALSWLPADHNTDVDNNVNRVCEDFAARRLYFLCRVSRSDAFKMVGWSQSKMVLDLVKPYFTIRDELSIHNDGIYFPC